MQKIRDSIFARKALQSIRRKARDEKRKRKKRLESLDLKVVVLAPEQVAQLRREQVEARRQQKTEKKEARVARIQGVKDRAAAKVRAELEARWGRELERAGWKETHKGWRHGNKASVSIEEALSAVRRAKEEEKAGKDEQIEKYLVESGWTGHANGVWGRPNWEKDDGLCLRTLRQAYKIQLGLDATAVEN